MAVYGMTFQSISVSWVLGGWLIDVIGIFPTALVAVGRHLDPVFDRDDRVKRATLLMINIVDAHPHFDSADSAR